MVKIKAMMKVAIGQTTSSADLAANLSTMRGLCERAASEGADWVCFAEMAYFTGSALENRRLAERFDELSKQFAQWAKELEIHILPGSLRSPATGGKSFNHALAFDPQGNRIADYRKIFLFKANLPERRYDEGELYEAGKELGAFEFGGTPAGMTICYDLRFPEVYRALRKRGAQIIFVPSAFTVPTGEAHWEALLRARAIENQCFLVAPSLAGVSGDSSAKFGHSIVVDPWGRVILKMGKEPGYALVDVDLTKIDEARKLVDPWASVRPELFPIG